VGEAVADAVPEPVAVAGAAHPLSSLMRLFALSAKTMLPPASTATPQGWKNEAPPPAPSANAVSPLPAIVLTTPAGVTRRTRWLLVSATTRFPPPSTAKPWGKEN
jgi:hypothetical protein